MRPARQARCTPSFSAANADGPPTGILWAAADVGRRARAPRPWPRRAGGRDSSRSRRRCAGAETSRVSGAGETVANPIVSKTRCTKGSGSPAGRPSIAPQQPRSPRPQESVRHLLQPGRCFRGRPTRSAWSADLQPPPSVEDRRDDNRHVGIAQTGRSPGTRGSSDRPRPSCPPGFEEEQHQVGTGGEVERVVADHECAEIRSGLFHRVPQHLDGVAADGVHLRVELEAEHAVAEIEQARTRFFRTTRPSARAAVISVSLDDGADASPAPAAAASSARASECLRRRGLRRSCRPRWRAVSSKGPTPTRSPSAWRDRCHQASQLPDSRSSRRRESLAPACS